MRYAYKTNFELDLANEQLFKALVRKKGVNVTHGMYINYFLLLWKKCNIVATEFDMICTRII